MPWQICDACSPRLASSTLRTARSPRSDVRCCVCSPAFIWPTTSSSTRCWHKPGRSMYSLHLRHVYTSHVVMCCIWSLHPQIGKWSHGRRVGMAPRCVIRVPAESHCVHEHDDVLWGTHIIVLCSHACAMTHTVMSDLYAAGLLRWSRGRLGAPRFAGRCAVRLVARLPHQRDLGGI